MVKVISTRDFKVRGKKVLLYGESGSGKTRLCSTAPNPIILSAESGLLSLADKDIAVIEITCVRELEEAYTWLTTTAEGKKFETICLDSLSDLAETLLEELKASNKDHRKAYGIMADTLSTHIRKFRDIKDKNVVFTAKLKKLADDSSGAISAMPGVPGQQLLQNLPYFFDEVFCLRISPGKDKTRYLQTAADYQFVAKDRSNKLDPKERPDLTHIFKKMTGGNPQK